MTRQRELPSITYFVALHLLLPSDHHAQLLPLLSQRVSLDTRAQPRRQRTVSMTQKSGFGCGVHRGGSTGEPRVTSAARWTVRAHQPVP